MTIRREDLFKRVHRLLTFARNFLRRVNAELLPVAISLVAWSRFMA